MSKNIDLLIVKPGSAKKIYGNLSSSLSAIEPPVWGGMLANFIRDKGYSVKILDMETEDLGTSQIADKIITMNPVLVNIVLMGPNPSASSTPLMVVTRELLNLLKEKNPQAKTILTGIHPSSLPERTLKEEKTDFVGRGESFYTILQLLEILKSGKKVEGPIKGLCHIREGNMISNGWGETIKDIKELPAVAWDLIDMDKYRAHNWHCFGHLKERSPYAVIYTSLGCPYNCSYCNIHAFYDGKPGIRFRSPENIIAEIDLLVRNYGVKNIKFLDELFAINEDRVNQVCDLIIERGYDLNIWAYARINTVNEKMLKKMKKAGINWLCYGIESGNQNVRTGVNKLGFGQDLIRKVIKMTQEEGISILGNFIFGLPDDNLQTMQETLDLAKELNCEYANFYATMAYPGSRLYEEAVKKGLRLPKSWLGFAQLNEETFPLSTKYLSGSDVLRFRDKAFKEYYSRPEYLKMIEEKFGPEEVSHINEMLKYEIKRKLV
jgi:radical SAM superfamily enzyme YgiQ (UPF0313 family)